MSKNSICPIIKELERIYDFLAEKTKLNKIAKRPIITIQTKGAQKNTLGWYQENKWTFKKQNISEINICAEALSINAVETLIHEMVHYHNTSLDISDCNSHQYHNKHFKTRAESYGLNVKNDGRHGWNHTLISKTLQDTLTKLNIKKHLFNLYRKENIFNPSVTKMKKYTCDCTTVRCATNLQARCEICKKRFQEE